MARKSIIEKVEKININPRYDLKVKDAAELIEMGKSAYELITVAFCYGYLRGSKAAKKELGGKYE